MHPLTALRAAQHLEELRREGRRRPPVESGANLRIGPDRRVAGAGARALSEALGSVATQLDPGETHPSLDDRADANGSRAMAA
jgi:hypothetical protein